MANDLAPNASEGIPVGGGRRCERNDVREVRPARVDFAVPTIRCVHCLAAIETRLREEPGVAAARANVTLRRVAVTPTARGFDARRVVAALAEIGHEAAPIDPADLADDHGREAQELLRALALAGFGAMNVMLLSVAVWSGAEGATRQAFHLLSAAIAVPVVLWSGRPFFAAAWAALRRWRLNMEVPISLAVLLATGLSLTETARGGEEVFFDAAVTLLFFLLIGRYLDRRMRDRARGAMAGLSRLAVKSAAVVGPDGSVRTVKLAEIRPGMRLRIAAGERMPVDARVTAGRTDLDRSLVTGEATPEPVEPGREVEAGALNLTGGVEVEALRGADRSFLARMTAMLATAEAGRGRYVRIADRAARLYAPVVHLLALATFVGWMVATGGDWGRAVFVAISVLIITCPCALALAVPVAHVVAAGRLLREGILMKDGSALERLAEIDRAVFDKTGTLTDGRPTVLTMPAMSAERAGILRALAAGSAHPAAAAIDARIDGPVRQVEALREVPGLGVEAVWDGRRVRLGRAEWVGEITREAPARSPAFAVEGEAPLTFDLGERLRPGARAALRRLSDWRIRVEIVSGDGEAAVRRVAGWTGIETARHAARPEDKVAHLGTLRDAGHRVLMVGDGLNDAAALAAAHVSISPGTASEVGRQAADYVFLRDDLGVVADAVELSRDTARIVRQNFALAIAYNCIAIPLAAAGFVTPLIAALAMSGSSIAVVANSLRLNGPGRDRPDPAPFMAKVPA